METKEKRLRRSVWSEAKIAEWIVKHFPEGYEDMIYAEPFLSSKAVLYRKRRSYVEILNDSQNEITNLFLVLRDAPKELKRVLYLSPYSREELAQDEIDETMDPIERARRYIIRASQAIGATGGSLETCIMVNVGGIVCRWNGISDTINLVANRLRGGDDHKVILSKEDPVTLLIKYDSPDAFVYVDPPFTVREASNGKKVYRCQMSEIDLANMMQVLNRTRAKVIVSGYPCPTFKKFLDGWYKHDCKVLTSIYPETIWMNYVKDCDEGD